MACSSTFMWLLELFSSFNGHEFNCTHLAACAVNRRQSLGNYVVITQRMQGSQHHRKPFFVIKKCESEPGCLPSAAVCVMTGFILYLILSLSPSLLLYLTLYLIYLSLSLSLHLTLFIMYLTLTLLSLSLSLNLTFLFKSNVLLFYCFI